MDDDTRNGLDRVARLREQLEVFKRQKNGELLLAPIEKWMIRELGVERLAKDGVIILYRHPAIAEIHGGDDSFVVHVIHGRNREMVFRKNFLEYLYRRLKEIIDQIETEARDV